MKLSQEDELAALHRRLREQDEELAEYRLQRESRPDTDEDAERRRHLRFIKIRLKAHRVHGLAWVRLLLAFIEAQGRMLDHDYLHRRLERDRGGCSDSALDVAMTSLRKALKRHGIRPQTIWGQGWLLADSDCTKLRELLVGLLD